MTTLAEIAGLVGAGDHRFPEPATLAQLSVFESTIGAELPDALKALYRQADGETVSYKQGSPGLFLESDFLSIARATHRYQAFCSVIEGDGQLATWDGRMVSLPSEVVLPRYFNPGWVPFAGSAQDLFAVDLNPGPKGVVGQIIWINPDILRRKRVASSLDEFLQRVVTLYQAKQWNGRFGGVWDLDKLPAV